MNKVALVGITTPRVAGVETPEQLLAYCARVSSAANQMNHETGPKLIRSLIRRKEWSPLEMISITMEIETTRDISRQILRHRSFSFQEFSQRYSKVDLSDPWFREARLQDHKDRQNSIETDDEDLQREWTQVQDWILETARSAYDWAVDRGIAKEQARAVLPEGLTPTRLYMAGTLRSWWHYCELRTGKETQREHREIAEEAWAIIKNEIPILGENETTD